MASQHSALNLRLGSTKLAYKVHPVVVFSILDHYKRRGPDQERVIGTLLGTYDKDGGCYIKSCFPVPLLTETEDSVVLDMDYHLSMLNLHRRVNKAEVVVGWYSTGNKISYISSLMHEVYKSQVETPVLLTVDVEVTKFDRMAIKGYVGRTLRVGRKVPVARFQEVSMAISAYEGEKIAVDALINGNPDGDALDAPATILNDSENLYRSLSKLTNMLESVSSYVNKVKEGTTEGDVEVGMAIAQAVAAVPHVDPEVFDRMFASNLQDLMMVMYLTNMTKTHLQLADKINNLL